MNITAGRALGCGPGGTLPSGQGAHYPAGTAGGLYSSCHCSGWLLHHWADCFASAAIGPRAGCYAIGQRLCGNIEENRAYHVFKLSGRNFQVYLGGSGGGEPPSSGRPICGVGAISELNGRGSGTGPGPGPFDIDFQFQSRSLCQWPKPERPRPPAARSPGPGRVGRHRVRATSRIIISSVMLILHRFLSQWPSLDL